MTSSVQANTLQGNRSAEAFLTGLASIVLALIVTALPVYAHAVSFKLAVAVCFISTLFVTRTAPYAVPAVLIISFLFQNTFVASVSPMIEGKTDFTLIRAYNFLILCTCWASFAYDYLSKYSVQNVFLNKYIKASTAVLAIIGLYMVYGFVSSSMNAVVYFRNIATPFLMFQICLVAAHYHHISWRGMFTVIGGICLIYAVAEFSFQEQFLKLFNGDHYLMLGFKDFIKSGHWVQQMHETGYVVRDVADFLKIDLFNSPLFKEYSDKIYRLGGPNFHAISFAYVMCFFMLISASRGKIWLCLGALPVLALVGSKGAFVFLFLVTAGMIIMAVTRRSSTVWLFAALIATYVIVAVIFGKMQQDYHVLGFLAGIDGFFSNPVGRGLGVGGNLTTNAAQIDWSRAQATGQAAAAVESAVGVLLYQMGIGAFAVIGFYLWLGVKLWHISVNTARTLIALPAVCLITMTANGVLQEEALFAPLAMGSVMLMAGLMLGTVTRPSALPR